MSVTLVVGVLIGCLPMLWVTWAAVVAWRGGYRVAAALPACVLLFVAGRIVVDTANDPSSHNLWPFELVIWTAAGLVALGLLALLRWGGGGDAGPPGPRDSASGP